MDASGACLGLWLLGAAFYFYMPLASMTNPPLNGVSAHRRRFYHALSRGQYDKTNPPTACSSYSAN